MARLGYIININVINIGNKGQTTVFPFSLPSSPTTAFPGRTVSVADKNDLILIAGKGHEDYQIIGTDKRDFDDRKVAAEAASQEA